MLELLELLRTGVLELLGRSEVTLFWRVEEEGEAVLLFCDELLRLVLVLEVLVGLLLVFVVVERELLAELSVLGREVVTDDLLELFALLLVLVS